LHDIVSDACTAVSNLIASEATQVGKFHNDILEMRDETTPNEPKQRRKSGLFRPASSFISSLYLLALSPYM
jgi:hypothetical protein